MAKCNRGSHHPQPVDDTQILAVRAMLALSESEHSDRLKETSDTLHWKYYANGSRHPYWELIGRVGSTTLQILLFVDVGRRFNNKGVECLTTLIRRNVIFWETH
jgi:hypothetical protein